MTTDEEHTGAIVGVRLDHNGPIVFCRYDAGVRAARPALTRGQRVRVDPGRGGAPREGVVAIGPEQIIAAPALDDAPRIVAETSPDGSGTITDADAVAGSQPGSTASPLPIGWTSADADAVTGSQGKPVDVVGDVPDVTLPPASNTNLTRATPSEGDANPTSAFLSAEDTDLAPVFLPAEDADLTWVDLARALGLAALPLPEAPPQRERDGER